VAGWATPWTDGCNKIPNQTTTATGTYGQLFGSLQVNIVPPGFSDRWAQWAWTEAGGKIAENRCGLNGGQPYGNLLMVADGAFVAQIVTVNFNQTTVITGSISARPPMRQQS